MPFTFDPAAGRYRTADGRFVLDSSVRRALDTVIDGQAVSMRALTQRLIDGQVSLAGWQAAMMQDLKSVHIVGATLANGGWAQMDQADWGWTGQRIRTQYSFLRGFAADLASGRQKLDGTALARAEMYAQAGRQTHRAAQARAAAERDMLEEKNVLGAADHCQSCLTETSRGWVPLGTLVPCGSRNCLSRCHCSIQYRGRSAAMAA